MNYFQHEYKGNTYKFILTNSAKTQIEKEQSKLFNNPELIKKANEYNNLQEKLKKNPKDKELLARIEELAIEMIPLSNASEGITGERLGYILLKNFKDYRETMTPELYREILDDIEEKYGILGITQILNKITETVFQQVEEINKKANDKNETIAYLSQV